MQTDDIVSSWLSGSDSFDNPAGPLFMAGDATTEEAMSSPDAGMNMLTSATTASCRPNGGCACC
ncbi:DUF6229 family protein [Dyella sp.]|uniref:DUF6229 family protein n=1 Tax=Dyella sp. TaxID=1869338 RepID=UPI002ED6101C